MINDFLMGTRHFFKVLCKQKDKSFFLSTLVALNVERLLHLKEPKRMDL